MAYKPVQMTQRTCSYCGLSYLAKDRRRIYCSSSCNTLACLSRKEKNSLGEPEDEAPISVKLNFSFANVATVAAGSLAADAVKEAGKALFTKKQPSNGELMVKLKEIEARVDMVQRGTLGLMELSNTIRHTQVRIEANHEPAKGLKQGDTPSILF